MQLEKKKQAKLKNVSVLPEKTPTGFDSSKGIEFMAELLRRLMNNSSGDILYICIYGAADKVGVDKNDAERLLKLAIKDRNANNPFAHFGFFT